MGLVTPTTLGKGQLFGSIRVVAKLPSDVVSGTSEVQVGRIILSGAVDGGGPKMQET